VLKNNLRKIPFPFLGYVFMLLGFLGLGSFVFALAIRSGWTLTLCALTVAAFASCVGCFYVRAWQISTRVGGRGWTLNNDPFRPDRERDGRSLYLQQYR
jgi:hypothetical protein